MANYSITIKEKWPSVDHKFTKEEMIPFKGLSYDELCKKLEDLVKETKKEVEVSTTRGTLLFWITYEPKVETDVWYRWPSASKMDKFISSFK